MGIGKRQFTVGIGIMLAEGIGDLEGMGAFFFGDDRQRKWNVFEPTRIVLALGMSFAHVQQ